MAASEYDAGSASGTVAGLAVSPDSTTGVSDREADAPSPTVVDSTGRLASGTDWPGSATGTPEYESACVTVGGSAG